MLSSLNQSDTETGVGKSAGAAWLQTSPGCFGVCSFPFELLSVREATLRNHAAFTKSFQCL